MLFYSIGTVKNASSLPLWAVGNEICGALGILVVRTKEGVTSGATDNAAKVLELRKQLCKLEAMK